MYSSMNESTVAVTGPTLAVIATPVNQGKAHRQRAGTVNFHVLKVNGPPFSRRDLYRIECVPLAPTRTMAQRRSSPSLLAVGRVGSGIQSSVVPNRARLTICPSIQRRHACLCQALSTIFLVSPQIPYPAKIRRDRGTEQVRASGPGAV